MLSCASAEGKRPANSRREAAPLSAVWRTEDRRGQNPRSVRRGALKASTTADCGFVAGRSRDTGHPSFSAGLLGAESRLRSPHFRDVAQIRVHVLYKLAEIPANTANPEFAASVTYRKHGKAENPGSIPVSATNSIGISYLRKRCTRLPLQSAPQKTSSGLEYKWDSLKRLADSAAVRMDRKHGFRTCLSVIAIHALLFGTGAEHARCSLIRGRSAQARLDEEESRPRIPALVCRDFAAVPIGEEIRPTTRSPRAQRQKPLA
jgi:hypothetical protein